MSDIKLDDAQIDVLLSDLFQCGFNVTAKQVQSLAREVKELRKGLAQRDAQIAALEENLNSCLITVAKYSGPDAAPPAPLVVNEVLHTATAAIYFDDSSDFGPALWSIVRAINPEIAELLEKDSGAAFNKTTQLSSCNGESVADE